MAGGFILVRRAAAAILFMALTQVVPAAEPQALAPFECIQLVRQARIARMQGHDDLARDTLLKAARDFPGETAPLAALWQFHVEVGLSDEQAAMVRNGMKRLLTGVPPHPASLFHLAGAPGLEAPELEMALAAAKTRLQSAPSGSSLLETLAVLQQRLGYFEEARDSFRQLARIDGTVESTWQTVMLDMELRDWDGMVRDLKPLLEDESGNPLVQLAYLEALARSGHGEAFVKHMEELKQGDRMDLDEILPRLMLQAAWGLRDRGEDGEAEKLFRRALAAEPQLAAARDALLYLYTPPEEQLARVAADRRRLIESNDADPVEVLNQGATLLAGGDLEGAYEMTRRAVELLPDMEIGWFNMGLICARLERWEEAAAAFEKAARLDPARPQTPLLLAQALHMSNRCGEAIAFYQKALGLEPERSEIQYRLHQCYLKTGQDELAARALEAFQEAEK